MRAQLERALRGALRRSRHLLNKPPARDDVILTKPPTRRHSVQPARFEKRTPHQPSTLEPSTLESSTLESSTLEPSTLESSTLEPRAALPAGATIRRWATPSGAALQVKSSQVKSVSRAAALQHASSSSTATAATAAASSSITAASSFAAANSLPAATFAQLCEQAGMPEEEAARRWGRLRDQWCAVGRWHHGMRRVEALLCRISSLEADGRLRWPSLLRWA